jgi:predicted alpha/beta-fold hydrolase
MPCRDLITPFTPAWWCRNPHLQTLWPYFFRSSPRPNLRRERLELPDGDFLDLDWTTNGQGPLVLLLHGLEGSARSHYVRAMAHILPRRGLRVVIMHFRGCSGEPNRLNRSYHSGETGDIRFVVNWLHEREPDTSIAAIGYSLGGNALLKYLGENGTATPLAAAVAVSVPFDLAAAADRMSHGVSRIYQWHMVHSLIRSLRAKFAGRAAPVDLDGLSDAMSFWEFDEKVTAPLHGFRDAADYYQRSSSRQFLAGIRVPTLILHARDDPFMTPSVVPGKTELAASITLDASNHGGHVGFVHGTWPWRPSYWLDERIPPFLLHHLRNR